MEIRSVCPYSFGANTYIVASGCDAFVIDPAVSVHAIVSAAAEFGAQLRGIILTHGHFDHTVSIDSIRSALSVPVYIHEDDAIMLTDGKKNAYYDFFGKECVHGAPEKLLRDGDFIRIGDEQLQVVHTPGHSKGSICLLGDKFIITGDTLFADSVGRCDLWGGSQDALAHSLQKLRSYDKALTAYPGHGAPAPLGDALDNSAYFF
jgi:glyoxylase-like metal-dependent hydrolase (beta-lactamase superfamily II)